MFSAVKNIVRLALHGDLAVFHGDDVIGVGGGLVDVVQYDDGGCACVRRSAGAGFA